MIFEYNLCKPKHVAKDLKKQAYMQATYIFSYSITQLCTATITRSLFLYSSK